jgi:hypothetical protein
LGTRAGEFESAAVDGGEARISLSAAESENAERIFGEGTGTANVGRDGEGGWIGDREAGVVGDVAAQTAVSGDAVAELNGTGDDTCTTGETVDSVDGETSGTEFS